MSPFLILIGAAGFGFLMGDRFGARGAVRTLKPYLRHGTICAWVREPGIEICSCGLHEIVEDVR